MKISRKIIKRSTYLFLLIFIGINFIAFFHAYKFTHFDESTKEKTKNPKDLVLTDKIKTLLFGVDIPKPVNKILPQHTFETIKLGKDLEIDCWSIKAESSKGVVILFHGYGGEKSTLIDKADIFLSQGYSTFLLDFMGSGSSKGTNTTIGFFEANQVKLAYDFIKSSGETSIFLYGTSMGSVAILKALNDFKMAPNGIIIECPFGSMYETVSARFDMMKVPAFPMAGLLVFWGGLQNGFWAFSHNPTEYAKSNNSPTLLMYGEKDEKVSRQEIDEIFQNLKGKKELKLFPDAGHENYLIQYNAAWKIAVEDFLKNN